MKRLHYLIAAVASLAAITGPAQADAIRVGMQLEPPHLDPTAGAAAAIREVTYANVFEGLTRFAEDGTVRPALAQSWDVSEDGLNWVFHLREDAVFHDGTPFTAEDVVFSFERAMAPDSINAQPQLFEGIAAVTAVDDATVEIALEEPRGALLFNLAWGDAVIVSPETAETNRTDPVGTGPFRFARWVQGDRVELVRFDDYWGEAPAIERVAFVFISDPTAAFAAMMAGDIDAFPAFPAPENLPQFEADPRFQVIVGTTEGQTILAMNNGRAPFDDIRVRQAIAHAIDRQAIIDGAMFGYGTPIGSHFAPHHPAYVDLTQLAGHDPERARALLAEAGHEGGFTATLALPPPSYARRGGEIVASQLRAVGIETQIVNMEWAQWLEQVFTSHDYDLTIVAHTEPLDIGIYAREDYYFNYDDPEMRGLMDRLRRTNDEGERAEILGAAQRRVAEQQVNAFLFQLARAGVADARIEGLWANVPAPANDMTAVSWREGS
jgi:peptide/nickel transport system substrate-binding protein